MSTGHEGRGACKSVTMSAQVEALDPDCGCADRFVGVEAIGFWLVVRPMRWLQASRGNNSGGVGKVKNRAIVMRI
jgi:hypothetical protein